MIEVNVYYMEQSIRFHHLQMMSTFNYTVPGRKKLGHLLGRNDLIYQTRASDYTSDVDL